MIPGRDSRTRPIPIVFVYVSDPVGAGVVASLARPGGNITGMLLYEDSITGKWLGMLKEISPRLSSDLWRGLGQEERARSISSSFVISVCVGNGAAQKYLFWS